MQNINALFAVFTLLIALTPIGCRSSSTDRVTYQYVKTWGVRGRDPGELMRPVGITITGNEVFISDSGNHRIQVFDLEGNFLRHFGEHGRGVGELNYPMHIDIRDDNLYVPSFLNNRIQTFSLSGELLSEMGAAGLEAGPVERPGGVAAAGEGRVYVAEFYNHRVQLVDTTAGTQVRQFGTGDIGVEPGNFSGPTDVAMRPGGGFVVTDSHNHRIQAFGPDGAFDWMVPADTTEADTSKGGFNEPTAVTVDTEGNIFVVDQKNYRIQKFASDGTFLVTIGEQGGAPDQFRFPMDMAVDGKGDLFVVDYIKGCVQIYSPIRASFPKF